MKEKTSKITAPIPENEFERIIQLSEYNLDYFDLENQLSNLTKLAAKVAGTPISLINLIDAVTQWSVATHGLSLKQIPREESICQYTIMDEHPTEVMDLSFDVRFMDKPFVKNDPKLKYYCGVPLRNSDGSNLGALCVMDHVIRALSPEKIELLQIIADEIVNQLHVFKVISDLKSKVKDIRENHKRVAHDIRGPIGGIIGLAQIIQDQGNENNLDEVLEFVQLIQNSGKSVLDLADDILSQDFQQKSISAQATSSAFTLNSLRKKLFDLYLVQAKHKEVDFQLFMADSDEYIPFPKNKMLQILGNLISNAIKFSPKNGKLMVYLEIAKSFGISEFVAIVQNTGQGISPGQIDEILGGNSKTSDGTAGEKGYGFGLPLVKYLVDGVNGKMEIKSILGEMTKFTIRLPL